MQTIRLNMSNNAPTQYTNFDYVSMIEFNGILLGAGPRGLHKMSCGADDAGDDIDAYFKTGPNLLEWSGKKKNRFIYLNVRTSGSIKITPVVDGIDGTPITFTPNDTENHYMKMSVSRNDMGYYWEYKIENVDGCSFSINEMEILPVYLSKRK